MKIDSNPLFKRFEYTITLIASLCSIASLSIMFLQNTVHATIALLSFFCFLILLFYRIHIAIKKWVSFSYTEGYLTLSTAVSMSTEDGKIYNYEVYKHIQCKQPMLYEFPYRYKWSGTNPPIITSNAQKIDGESIIGEKNNYDYIKLKFKEPIFFNEMAVIHILMKLDDSDNKASTHLEVKIDKPVKMLQQKVELKHKDYSYNEVAVIKKKLINSQINLEYEIVDYIKFDQLSKSYVSCIIDPEPGYFYKLEWKR